MELVVVDSFERRDKRPRQSGGQLAVEVAVASGVVAAGIVAELTDIVDEEGEQRQQEMVAVVGAPGTVGSEVVREHGQQARSMDLVEGLKEGV
ncbi:unnamed protein product [Linum trigynum]|uniref:Uncharacterized protein n=1 Tax=Linum trigynum TaxID=586398 RepID=A0AAV2F0V8_9ROSI